MFFIKTSLMRKKKIIFIYLFIYLFFADQLVTVNRAQSSYAQSITLLTQKQKQWCSVQ